MSFQPNFPPSLLAKVSEDNADTKKRSKEEYRKMKELEEARKSATVPAMKDEEGRDINPHIPQYIMQAPWYYGSLKPTLTHQRMQDDEKASGSTMLNQWYKRGVKEGTTATKFRKGACENCGSMTHKKRDCFERPRKLGAIITGDDIAPDEFVQPELELGFEGKRDRWNGYDPREHRRLVEEFQRLEEARKLVKAKQIDDSLASQSLEDPVALANGDDKDEDKYGDELDMPGQKFDSKQRQSIRNLRIREDTAKYLYNLDPNSAYYDPKTRSMRENPFGEKPAHEVPYAGDNVQRFAGDTMAMMQSQVFAWDMHGDRGLNVHLQADPTRLELLKRKVKEANTEVRSTVKEDILEKYGGREHLESAPARDLLMSAQSEAYIEYSRTGQVIKGAEKPKVLSKYEEDIFLNNHTSVWGSFWCQGQWGFRCCHSNIKESYCTGEAGLVASLAKQAASTPSLPPPMPASITAANSDVTSHAGDKRKMTTEREMGEKKKKKREESSSDSSSDSSDDSSSSSNSDTASSFSSEEERRKKKKTKRSKKRKTSKKQKKSKKSNKSKTGREEGSQADQIKAAIAKELARQRDVDKIMKTGERDWAYNSHYESKQPTEMEIEAFHRTKILPDDPMNQFPSTSD